MAVQLTGNYTGQPAQNFSEEIRAEFYLTQTDFYNFSDDVTLQIQIKLLDGSVNFRPGYGPTIAPPITLPEKIKLVVMKLNI